MEPKEQIEMTQTQRMKNDNSSSDMVEGVVYCINRPFKTILNSPKPRRCAVVVDRLYKIGLFVISGLAQGGGASHVVHTFYRNDRPGRWSSTHGPHVLQ